MNFYPLFRDFLYNYEKDIFYVAKDIEHAVKIWKGFHAYLENDMFGCIVEDNSITLCVTGNKISFESVESITYLTKFPSVVFVEKGLEVQVSDFLTKQDIECTIIGSV